MIEWTPSHELPSYRFWPIKTNSSTSVIDGAWHSFSGTVPARPHRVLPVGESGIGFLRTKDRQGTVSQLDLVLVGGSDQPHWHQPRPGQELIMVSLRPERMAAALGLSSREFLSQPIASLADEPIAQPFIHVVELAWRGAAAEQLLPCMVTIVANLERQNELVLSPEAVLADQLRCEAQSGTLSQMAEELGISARTLRRRFRDLTGFGPKSYGRWLRLSRAAIAADPKVSPNWADIAAGAGYYDQSHMISDFKALTGLTPAQSHQERRGETPVAAITPSLPRVTVFSNTLQTA